MPRVYLDHHATTPLDPRVLEAMLPYFTEKFGNAASRTHLFGDEAERGVEWARGEIARLIGADSREIVFTSGATESNNLALQGVARFYAEKGNHVITTRLEHRSVLDICAELEKRNLRVTYLPIDSNGCVDPADVRRAITGQTILISVIFASHEIGTLQDVQAMGRIAKDNGILFHCDATQALGKEPIDVQKMGIDLLSISAHKLYGPKGAGALYVRRKDPRVRLVPLLFGGGHERNLRPGTLNVPAIVGFGKACGIAEQEMENEKRRLRNLRQLLWKKIEKLDGVRVNGHPTRRLAGNLNVSFGGIEGHALLRKLRREIALSLGAACTSALPEPSYVLQAIGLPAELISSSVRFGLGRFNTEDEIRWAAERVCETVEELRARGLPRLRCV